MRLLAALATIVALSGCIGPSQEQRCYEASKAVAEATDRALNPKPGQMDGYVRWSELEAAKSWRESECESWFRRAMTWFDRITAKVKKT